MIKLLFYLEAEKEIAKKEFVGTKYIHVGGFEFSPTYIQNIDFVSVKNTMFCSEFSDERLSVHMKYQR